MQIFVIHGGDAFASYEEYLNHLINWPLDIARLKGSDDWKRKLSQSLGDGYEVFNPSMPNARNAKYLEWKIWLEKCVPFMADEIILIGHSLGAIFLAKYLSEEDFPKKIKATFLVAAPFNDDGGRPIVEFTLPPSLQKLHKQGGKIFLYHSKDDPVVPFSELSLYQAQLPDATSRVFENRGHFNQEKFPEIIADIKSLS